MGRPTIYNKELADKICSIIATHPFGLKKLTKMYDEMPAEITVNKWRWKHEYFAMQFAKAKLVQAELLAEDCLDISDDTSNDTKINANGTEVCNSEYVNRSRLRVDTRKWIASKLRPRQYGDAKQIQELEDHNDELRLKVKELKAKLDEDNKKEY